MATETLTRRQSDASVTPPEPNSGFLAHITARAPRRTAFRTGASPAARSSGTSPAKATPIKAAAIDAVRYHPGSGPALRGGTPEGVSIFGDSGLQPPGAFACVQPKCSLGGRAVRLPGADDDSIRI